MLQNLKAVQIASTIFLVLNLLFRIFYTILSEDVTHAQNFPEFSLTNWLYISITPIFIIISNYLINAFNKSQTLRSGMSLLVITFSIYIITSGLISSLMYTHDLHNSLIFYLIAIIFTGIVFLYEYEDTIMLTMTTGIIYSALLFYYNLSTPEMLYNHMVSAFLLAGFFFISRYAYSFRATFYLQLVEIREKNIEIEKASIFKNEVLGMVAHDLRNPIGAVESIAMIMELEDLDDDMTDNIMMIKASCVKARAIINDLLEVARDNNSEVLETEKSELNALLTQIIEQWRFRDNIKNHITLVSNKRPLYAAVNIEKFHRVIDNLISNAIKFSKDTDKVEICLNETKEGIQIEVKDHGLGIPKEMIPHIFERFSKAGRRGVRGEQSTGLGLSIVRQIVEKHNGQIEVESQEKQGSTFRIKLPQAV